MKASSSQGPSKTTHLAVSSSSTSLLPPPTWSPWQLCRDLHHSSKFLPRPYSAPCAYQQLITASCATALLPSGKLAPTTGDALGPLLLGAGVTGTGGNRAYKEKSTWSCVGWGLNHNIYSFLYHLTVIKYFRFFNIKTKLDACRASNGQADHAQNRSQGCPLSKQIINATFSHAS